MANSLYNPFKQKLLSKAIDMQDAGDVIKASLIDSADYTFSAAHDEYSGGSRDVALAAIVAESASLTTLGALTVTDGVFDSPDFTWATVTGDVSEAIILWDDTITNDAPIAFYDTGIGGMPVTPNGGNINVQRCN